MHIYGDTPRHTPRQPTPHTAHPATTPQRRGGGDSRVHVYRDTPRNPGTPHTTPRTPRAHDTPHATPQGRGGGGQACAYIRGTKAHPAPHPTRHTTRPPPAVYQCSPGKLHLSGQSQACANAEGYTTRHLEGITRSLKGYFCQQKKCTLATCDGSNRPKRRPAKNWES